MRHSRTPSPLMVFRESSCSRLRARAMTYNILLCVFFAASMVAHAQSLPPIGPPPVSQTVARQQFRTLLERVDPGNRQQTVETLSHLAIWYRDPLDEELISAWRRDDRTNLTE